MNRCKIVTAKIYKNALNALKLYLDYLGYHF